MSEVIRQNPNRVEFELTEGVGAHIETRLCEDGLGGAYGSWGTPIPNEGLQRMAIEFRGYEISPDNLQPPEKLSHDFGFDSRYCVPNMISDWGELAEKFLPVEVAYAGRLARAAAEVSGFAPQEVEGLIISSSVPLSGDFTNQVAWAAGFESDIPTGTVHIACAGGAEALRLALTEETLQGKKVVVGGVEGLGRLIRNVPDAPLQLFGNGAAMLGLIPGVTAKLLASERLAVGDPNRTMAFERRYHHEGPELLYESGSFRAGDFVLAGAMPEPNSGEIVSINNLFGMMKLFIENGPGQIVRVIQAAGTSPDVWAIHHMNKKIMEMYERKLSKIGHAISLPWLFTKYGNISSASSVMALLHQNIQRGQRVLMHGLGVGGYFSTSMFEVS